MLSTRAANTPITTTNREETRMRTDTLSGAYAAKLGRYTQPALQARALPPTAPPTARTAAPLPDAEALLIALRRSLASCRDTSQLRMLAAFEGPQRIAQ